MKKERLIHHLKRSENGELPISFFKEFFPPLSLAKELEAYSNVDMVEIDWKRMRVRYIGDLGKEIKNRYKAKIKISPMPDYMKITPIEKNKPYL